MILLTNIKQSWEIFFKILWSAQKIWALLRQYLCNRGHLCFPLLSKSRPKICLTFTSRRRSIWWPTIARFSRICPKIRRPFLKKEIRFTTWTDCNYPIQAKKNLTKQFGLSVSDKAAPIVEFGMFGGLFTSTDTLTTLTPQNSWSPHFIITLWNQKSRNAGTSCN